MEVCYPPEEWETHGNENWMSDVLNMSPPRDGNKWGRFVLASIRHFASQISTVLLFSYEQYKAEVKEQIRDARFTGLINNSF